MKPELVQAKNTKDKQNNEELKSRVCGILKRGSLHISLNILQLTS